MSAVKNAMVSAEVSTRQLQQQSCDTTDSVVYSLHRCSNTFLVLPWQ